MVRVIVTRPSTESSQWVTALRAAGHEAVGLPLIAVAPAPQPQGLADARARLASFDAVMFVSSNAVTHFFAPDVATAPVLNATKPRAYVTGPGSCAALERAGFPRTRIDAPDPARGQFDSEALWSVVQGQVKPGFRLLIVRGGAADDPDQNLADLTGAGEGRDWLASQVLAAGGRVEFVVSYLRRLPTWEPDDVALVRRAAQDGSVWLFSSSQAIANLQRLCPGQVWSAAKAVVTHARIGQSARDAGFGVVCESRPLLPALLASIESLQ